MPFSLYSTTWWNKKNNFGTCLLWQCRWHQNDAAKSVHCAIWKVNFAIMFINILFNKNSKFNKTVIVLRFHLLFRCFHKLGKFDRWHHIVILLLRSQIDMRQVHLHANGPVWTLEVNVILSDLQQWLGIVQQHQWN